jgi:hypothetical protein
MEARAAGTSEVLQSRAGPKQRKLLKTMKPKRCEPRKTTTETAQAAETEAKQDTSIAGHLWYFTE